MIKFHVRQRIVCAAFFLLCFFSSPLPQVYPDQINADNDSYSKLSDLFNRYFRLEEESFQRLTFKLSADQAVKSGISFKLTLEDNLGIKWIFKEKGTNSVIAHKLYTLFGLESPEIHKIKLLLNSKLYSGTLQKFIPADATLCSYYRPSSVSSSGLDYLLKAQVIDWLMKDYDPNCSNFLVLSKDKENKADKLIRIDQTCAFENFESGDPDHEHMVVLAKRLKGEAVPNCYREMQEAFRKKEIDLDLKRAYAFVRFIADFPGSAFQETVNDRQNDPGMSDKKNKFFVSFLKSNSRKMPGDFRKFYSRLAASRGVRIDLAKDAAVSDDLERTCASLRNRLSELEKTVRWADNDPGDRYVRISAIASLEGFQVMSRIYELCWFKKGDLDNECDKALRTLEELSSGAHPNEKKAISLYAQEIFKIKEGKGMSYQFNQINKLVDPIPQKNKSEFD